MNTFPLDQSKHIIFCIIAAVFFIAQFFRQGFKYQLITAAAVLVTLLLYVNPSSAWRNIIGITEAVLVLMIFVVMAIEKKKVAKKEKEETAVSEGPAAEENNGN